MAEKSRNADSGKEIKEKKEKTTQQQKGLPILSADLNYMYNLNVIVLMHTQVGHMRNALAVG